jgi:hypothetical protein
MTVIVLGAMVSVLGLLAVVLGVRAGQLRRDRDRSRRHAGELARDLHLTRRELGTAQAALADHRAADELALTDFLTKNGDPS